MADEGTSGMATVPLVTLSTPNGNGTTDGRAKVAVLTWLGVIAVVFALGLVTIGVSGIVHPAQDPQGVNAVREDLKSFLLVIVGAFTGILTTTHGAAR